MPTHHPPLFVLYVPALDRRRVSAEHTPFVCDLLGRFPEVELRTLPTTELLPTMITGVLPHQHHVWQVSLDPNRRTTPLDRVLDRLPDFVTTTAQCVRQALDSSYDLAAIPRWRRRQFVLHRMKYTRRVADGLGVLANIGGFPSLFALVEGSQYHFAKTFDEAAAMVDELPRDNCRFAFFEHYALDLYSHWNLDHPEDVLAKAAIVDGHARRLYERCSERGVRFALLVDHGQEAVRKQVDVRAAIEAAGVPREELLYFLEVAVGRLWFFSDRARREVVARLRDVPGLHVLHRTEMHDYGVRFEDDTFGEYYLIADHGTTFFPHDFYQPLANLYMSWKIPGHRTRRGNPVHRGYHGQLPTHPSERGYLAIADDTLERRQAEAELTDIAPTVLDLLGVAPPAHMRGRPVYRHHDPAAVAAP